MAGKFKFMDFLSKEEQEAVNRLRETLGGKTIYIPYPDKDPYHEYLEKRNQRICRMFEKYKMLGLPEEVIYAEISIRLSCAYKLSMNRIRAIIKGYGRKKV